MRTFTPALLTFLGALVLCPLLEAAPRGGVAKSSTTEEETTTSRSTQNAPLPPPVMTRRIITKVDGVVVSERDATAVDAPILYEETAPPPPAHGNEQPSPQALRVPEGVVYEPGKSDSVMPEDATENELEAEPPTASEGDEESDSGFLGGMFGNFFDPNREASSSRMRAGKGRAMHLAPEGDNAPSYETVEVPEPPKSTPYIAPSRNLIIGEVVSVNDQEGIVVAWMQTRFIALDRNVITRNHELETTAVLRPTTYRNGHAYGLDIAVGLPSVGDEVVLTDAGPAIRRQDELSYNVSVSVEPSAQN